jgi:hypothetical protein
MYRIVAGAVLGAVLLAATGCSASKDEGPKYKDPGITIKPLPRPADPGGAPGKKAAGNANAAN